MAGNWHIHGDTAVRRANRKARNRGIRRLDCLYHITYRTPKPQNVCLLSVEGCSEDAFSSTVYRISASRDPGQLDIAWLH